MPRPAALVCAVACVSGLLAACGAPSTSPSATTPTLVATTTVLGDIAGRIARCGGKSGEDFRRSEGGGRHGYRVRVGRGP